MRGVLVFNTTHTVYTPSDFKAYYEAFLLCGAVASKVFNHLDLTCSQQFWWDDSTCHCHQLHSTSQSQDHIPPSPPAPPPGVDLDTGGAQRPWPTTTSSSWRLSTTERSVLSQQFLILICCTPCICEIKMKRRKIFKILDNQSLKMKNKQHLKKLHYRLTKWFWSWYFFTCIYIYQNMDMVQWSPQHYDTRNDEGFVGDKIGLESRMYFSSNLCQRWKQVSSEKDNLTVKDGSSLSLLPDILISVFSHSETIQYFRNMKPSVMIRRE